MSVNKRIEQIIFEGIDKISTPSKTAQGSVKALGDTISNVQQGLAAIGVTVGGGAFVALHMQSLKATAALDDMSEATGASVENLSAIQNVVKVAGGDFEGLTGQVGKMLKGLKDGTEEGNKAAHAFKFLGVQTRDARGHIRDSGLIIIDTARAISKYADEGEKAQIVQDALGKGAERHLPLLKDIAAGTDLHSKVTKEQAAQAEEAEKNINRLKVALEDSRRELVNDSIPAVIRYTNELLAAKNALGGWYGGLSGFFSIGGKEGDDPIATIDKIDTKLKQLRADRSVLGGDSLGAKFNRMVAPEDLAMLDQQIAFQEQRRRVLLGVMQRSTFKNTEGMVEDAAGIHPAPALPRSGYKPLDESAGKRLKPAEIAKMQAAGQEEFNELVKKANVEMYKYLDEEQKKSLKAREDGEKAYWQMLSDLHDGEQERAVEEGAARLQVEEEKKRFREQNFGIEEVQAAEEHERRLERLQQFSDEELELVGGRQALLEGMEAMHQARLLEIERNKHQAQRSMEVQTLQLAANLLQMFAGKSKAAALAVIAINKGLAIGQTQAATAAAIMRAYSDLGPIGGSAMAPKIAALGALQIGIIAATGLVEAGQVLGSGGGGADISAPSPVVNVNPNTGLPTASSGESGAVGPHTFIVIEGKSGSGLFTEDDIRELAERLEESTRHGGRVTVVTRR